MWSGSAPRSDVGTHTNPRRTSNDVAGAPHDDHVSRVRFDSTVTVWTVRDFVISIDAPFTISDALGAVTVDPAHIGRDGGLVTDRVLAHDIAATTISDDGTLTIALADEVNMTIGPSDDDWAWSIVAPDGSRVTCESKGELSIRRRDLTRLPHGCDQMTMAIREPELPMTYDSALREYSIIYSNEAYGHHHIDFCPFCGAALPPSLRDEWFERLDALGLEPSSPELPDTMRDDRWWREV